MEALRDLALVTQATLLGNKRAFDQLVRKHQSAVRRFLLSLTLGYRLKLKPLEDIKVQSVRLYATASNLFTITPSKGYDPEVASGTDNGVYPASRSFVFGVNVTL